MNRERSTKDGPFSWQSKAALGKISDACDSRTDKAHVLAVYVALTWLASNKQSESFDVHIRNVAAVAGVSYKKAAEILSLLVGLGLVESRSNFIDGTKEKGANTYTLRAVCPTLGTVNPRLGTAAGLTTLPRVLEESLEESIELAPEGAKAVQESQPVSVPTKKPRERNALTDALAAVDGSDPRQVTGPSWAAIGVALKAIREVSAQVTADEITRRAANYRQHMPGITITAMALAKHWAKCDRPPQTNPVSHAPARDYQPFTT